MHVFEKVGLAGFIQVGGGGWCLRFAMPRYLGFGYGNYLRALASGDYRCSNLGTNVHCIQVREGRLRNHSTIKINYSFMQPPWVK